MDDDRTPLFSRSTLLAGAAAVLAGCTGNRRASPPPASPAGSRSGTPQRTASATAAVPPATGSPTTGATPTTTPSAAVSATAGPTPAPPPRGDEAALLAAAVTRERVLLTAYDKAIRQVPALAPTLRALRAHHQAHADRLQGKAVPPPAGGGRRFTPSRPTEATAAVLRTLTEAEVRAARAGVSAVGGASPAMALLLAEIAGSEEQHAVLLRWLSGPRA
jgi:hypothetical protein